MAEKEIKIEYDEPQSVSGERTESRIEDIWGNFPQVTAIPTWTPRRFEESMAVDTTANVLYVYDFTDGAWFSSGGTVRRYIQFVVTNYTSDTSTGDGKAYAHIPNSLNGLNLVEVHAEVITAGTTNTTDIQIHNLTQAADMLSTKLTIDSTETGSDTAATAAVIDTANDDVAENDVIRIDVDAVHSTPAKGLLVTLGFE